MPVASLLWLLSQAQGDSILQVIFFPVHQGHDSHLHCLGDTEAQSEPRKCRYIDCAYLHVKDEDNSKIYALEMEVKELREEVQKLM